MTLARDGQTIVFAGTPQVAVPALESLVAGGAQVARVVTRPDAPLGRKRVLTPSPVAAAADRLGIPTLRASALRDGVTDEVEGVAPDLGVVVAYGGLVPPRLLAVPRLGWINVHFSLLPRWRGAAPVQRALIAGDEIIGTCVFQLVEALDAGDVFDSRSIPAGDTATAGELLTALSVLGGEQLVDVVTSMFDGTARARPQVGEVTVAPKLSLADGVLDWHRTAAEIIARYRGVTPEPGAQTTFEGQRLKVLRMIPTPLGESHMAPGEVTAGADGVWVGTGSKPVLVTDIQPSGKGPMRAADWLRGRHSAGTSVRWGS